MLLFQNFGQGDNTVFVDRSVRGHTDRDRSKPGGHVHRGSRSVTDRREEVDVFEVAGSVVEAFVRDPIVVHDLGVHAGASVAATAGPEFGAGEERFDLAPVADDADLLLMFGALGEHAEIERCPYAASYTVIECLYIMFCANTRPRPDATTLLGAMSPVTVLTSASGRSELGIGTVVVVEGGIVVDAAGRAPLVTLVEAVDCRPPAGSSSSTATATVMRIALAAAARATRIRRISGLRRVCGP